MSTRKRASNPQRGMGKLGCGCLFIIIISIGIGAASFIAIERGANFPGAEALRNAGSEGKEIFQQTRQSSDGNGTAEEDQSAPLPSATRTSPSTPPSQSSANGRSAAQLTPISLPRPDQSHYEYKAYMLELINAERQRAGVPPVTLGVNIAAQLHAEISLANCFSGHWGVDGLKPYMRYSLAGGYQTINENASGLDYCIKASDRYRPLSSIEAEIRKMMDGWTDSPGHRRNILDKWHKRVNIGLAWDRYNIVGYQHFEGDYVEFAQLPEITNRTLTISGRATNGLRFSSKEQLGLQIYYDPPPRSLTVGQIARTYCYDSGVLIAGVGHFLIDVDLNDVDLNEIGLSDIGLNDVGLSDINLTDVSFWVEDEFTTTYSPCPGPDDVPPGAPAPSSPQEARRFWQDAYAASENRIPQPITVQWITASKWTARDTDFSVKANISELLSKYGPGVYSLVLWSEVGGDEVPISQYSIFHQVEPPDTYNPHVWK